jgi:hypothetical protein
MQAASKSGSLVLTLDREELRHLNNALNEVCNGFTVANFEAAIGVTRLGATDLLRRVHQLDGQKPIELELTDLDALRNSLTAVLSELEPWEYSTRMGFEVSESEALRNRLDALAGELRFGSLPQTA